MTYQITITFTGGGPLLADVLAVLDGTVKPDNKQAPTPATKTPAKKAPAKKAPAKKAPSKAPETDDGANTPAQTSEAEETPSEDAGEDLLDRAVTLATKLLADGRKEKVKAALATTGAKRVTELDQDQVAQFIEALQ